MKFRRILPIVLGVLAVLVIWQYWLPLASASFYSGQFSPDFDDYYKAGGKFLLVQDPYVIDSTTSIKGYLYPPTVLPIFSMFAQLEYEHARRAWIILYIYAYLFALFVLVRRSAPTERLLLLVLAGLLTLTSDPFLYHIRQGQIDVIVSSLSLISFVAYLDGRKIVSAVLLAIGTIIKVNPIFFLVLYVFFFRDARYIVYFLFSVALLTAVSLLWVPVSFYADYVTRVLPLISLGSSYYLNQSLVKYAWGNGLLPRAITVIGLGLLSTFAWWLGRRQRTNPSAAHPQATSLLCYGLFIANTLVMLLVAPIAWHMAYVWTLLPLAKVLSLMFKKYFWRILPIVAVAALLINAQVYDAPGLDSWNMLGAILLLGTLVVMLTRRELALHA